MMRYTAWDGLPEDEKTTCKVCGIKIWVYWYLPSRERKFIKKDYKWVREKNNKPKMDMCANHFFGRK